MEEDNERKQVYARVRQELLTRELSNSQHFDGAVLTLSTGLLALSLAFIKDVTHIDETSCMGLLTLSWWGLGGAVVTTLASFITSQVGIRRQLLHAEKYYLEKRDEYLSKRNVAAIVTDVLNYISAGLFIGGVALSVVFVSSNL